MSTYAANNEARNRATTMGLSTPETNFPSNLSPWGRTWGRQLRANWPAPVSDRRQSNHCFSSRLRPLMNGVRIAPTVRARLNRLLCSDCGFVRMMEAFLFGYDGDVGFCLGCRSGDGVCLCLGWYFMCNGFFLNYEN